MPIQNKNYQAIEEFLKLLFGLWLEAQKAIKERKIIVTRESNFRQCINFERDQRRVKEIGNLGSIKINNKEIEGVISSDKFLILKLSDDIFLAICVCKELGNYILKITGLDFTNKNQGEIGLKTEYLIILTERLGISVNIRSNGSDPNQRLRKNLLQPLKREQIFKEDDKYRNVYFDFTFKLKEDLKTQENIINNVNYYMNIVTGGAGKGIVYIDLPNPSSTDAYVEHFNTETQSHNLDTLETKCKQQIEKSNFIRIKGSMGMGKSELLKQLFNYCQHKNYLTIKIDFRLIERTVFNDLKDFSRTFSNQIMREIINLNNLNEDKFVDYETKFDPDSINISTTNYFNNQILNLIDNDNKLILAMDNVDRLFTSEITEDICSLWRSWYDADNLIRQKMVMIITHSTDEYPDYNINSSPLKGIGYVPVLTDWEKPQIQQICQQYQLNLTDLEIEQLISQIGGHPYLIRLAINYLYEQKTTVKYLLEIRLKEDISPFSDYLDQILQHLQNLPDICQIYAKILNNEPIKLNINTKFHLKGMGLIKYNDEQILPKYSIYKDYFLPRIQEVI